METFIAAGGTFAAAGQHRPHRHRERPRHRHRARRRPYRAGQRSSSLPRSTCTRPSRSMVGREQLPAAFLKKLDGFQYTAWSLFGLHLALNESPRFAAEKFDPNINRSLKWSIGAETMEDLFSAHQDVQAGRVPKIVQFGSGPLSLLDPTQAPPGKHTTYCWHVMPLDPDLGGRSYESFKERILRQDHRHASRATART